MTVLPDLRRVGEEVARSLAYSRVRNSSIFITPGLNYPNGASVVVRIDPDPDGFIVSDDAYAALVADNVGAISTFNKIAASLAKRSGVEFERKTIFLRSVQRDALVGAVVAVANTSARALDRTIAHVEQAQFKRSRDLFDARLAEAFGDKVQFNVPFIGVTGHNWEFDAGVEDGGTLTRLFAFVMPAFTAVAAANMKIGDTRAMEKSPPITAALADYDATDPTLRAILSSSADAVIAANDDVSKYLVAG